jgi:ligand-binding sensor domain-containing protein
MRGLRCGKTHIIGGWSVNRLWKLAWLAMSLVTIGHALDPQKAISQFVHTVWTDREGAPQNIQALAQTRDGYLWLGTPTGLYRFDGVYERAARVGGKLTITSSAEAGTLVELAIPRSLAFQQ